MICSCGLPLDLRATFAGTQDFYDGTACSLFTCKSCHSTIAGPAFPFDKARLLVDVAALFRRESELATGREDAVRLLEIADILDARADEVGAMDATFPAQKVTSTTRKSVHAMWPVATQ